MTIDKGRGPGAPEAATAMGVTASDAAPRSSSAPSRMTMFARGARFVRRAPFAVGVTAVLWGIGAATGSLTAGPGRRLVDAAGAGADALAAGHWWAPITSAAFCTGLSTYLVAALVLLTAGTAVERRIGTLRTTAAFVVSQAVGVGLAAAVIGAGAAVGDHWLGHMAAVRMVGPWAGLVGLLTVGAAALAPVGRRRWRLVIFVALITAVLYVGNQASMWALFGGVAGLGIGIVLVSRRRRHVPARSVAEKRVLVALLVAASAAGPLATLLTGVRLGPLAVLDFLMLPSAAEIDDPASLCSVAGSPGAGCGVTNTSFLVDGIGPVLQSLLPALLLLVLADGLRRGRRSAYLATVVVNIGVALLGLALSGRQVADLLSDSPIRQVPAAEVWVTRFAPVLLPLLVVVVVVRQRRLFTIRAPWQVYRQWSLAAGATALLLAGGYVGLGLIVRNQFRPAPTIGMLFADLPARFAPVGYLGYRRLHFLPVGTAAQKLYVWTGPAFWCVVLVLTVAVFWRARSAPETPYRGEVSEILREYGSNGIGYMALWQGNRYVFTPERDTVVAYRVIAGVAVTTGAPIGPDPRGAFDAFVQHCADYGWTPCWFSVPEDFAMLAERLGYGSLVVASDTPIDLASMSFTGKKWQDIRTARNRAKKDGVTTVWSTFPDLPAGLRDQIRTIDRDWLATKRLPEMGFTLGGLAELDDPEVRCLLALGADGRVLAVTSWLPSYRGGRTVGWTLDFMRRGPGAFPGVMEYLIATALSTFRDEGAESASLSGVPLACPPGPAQAPGSAEPVGTVGAVGPVGTVGTQPHATVARIMETMAGVLEPAYGFRSLLAFKSKFGPRLEPLYLCYATAASLPVVANAVLRAYVPHMTPAQTAGVLRLVARSKAPVDG